MLNKIVSVLLCLILCVGASNCVFAEEITVRVAYDASSDSISVSGSVSGEKATVPLALEITDSSGHFVAGFQTIANEYKGEILYEFDKIQLPYSAATGTYTFTVSGHFMSDTDSATLEYYGVDVLYSLFSDINNVIGGDTSMYTNAFSFAKANADVLMLSGNSLTSLGTEAQNIFNTVIRNQGTYWLPAQSIDLSDDDMAKLRASYVTLLKNMSDALTIAEFSNMSSHTSVVDWINQYYTLYNFDKESAVTDESEVALTAYIDLMKNNSAFTSKLSNENSLTGLDDIQRVIYKWALLSTIATQNDHYTVNILSNFKTLFPVTSISSAQMAVVCGRIAQKPYNSYEEVVEAFNTKAGEVVGGSGHNRQEGSSVGGTISVGNVTPTMPNVPSLDSKFNDLGGVEWALTAINYLADKGIINGKGNGMFVPNDHVKRAEFVKMIVEALNLPLSEQNTDFSDVPPAAWYSTYVASAVRAGVVQGNENGQFMPDERISRQDMAVILYRAFQLESGNIQPMFADSDSISGYAKEAVATLNERGIIKGFEDNTFGPLQLATRAQAAQMLYSLIVHK